MEQANELLTAREMAKREGASPETVRAWSRRGCIPTLRLSPKVIRYNAEAVLAALATKPAGVPRPDSSCRRHTTPDRSLWRGVLCCVFTGAITAPAPRIGRPA